MAEKAAAPAARKRHEKGARKRTTRRNLAQYERGPEFDALIASLSLDDDAKNAVRQFAKLIYRQRAKSPEVVAAEEKLKIGNIVAQRLHIHEAADMLKFCERLQSAYRAFGDLVSVTAVKRKTQSGNRSRPGPTALILNNMPRE